MLRMKKGDQHRTKVKKTKPKTLDAFCSVATALAASDRLLFLPAKNLDVVNTACLTKDSKKLEHAICQFIENVLLR